MMDDKMLTIQQTLQNIDAALIPLLGRVWGVKVDRIDADEALHALREAMLIPGRVEGVWDTLSDAQRGALQMLISSGGKMPTSKFNLLFGEIRKMGKGIIEREKPLENPTGVAEALFYRGFIAETFEQASAGMRGVIYVPVDLAAVLPLHKTAYQHLDEGDDLPLDEEDAPGMIETLEQVQEVRTADTTIVDDLTTFLAYLQLKGGIVEGEGLNHEDSEALLRFLMKPDAHRLAFLLGIGLGGELIEIQGSEALPKRAEARRWLSAPRAEQIRFLCEAWRKSQHYRDLWHVPGLHPEPTGWPYNPVVGRDAVLHFMAEFVPQQGWWSIEELISTMKEVEPDFQRPGGDYDSWYIRSDSGGYLHGFESWEAVEGALLEFYIIGPMHWLGLVDLAQDAARLTAYGRAFVNRTSWPNPQESEERVIVKPDGLMLASRKVPRVDRFQLARFCTWVQSGDPFIYKLDAEGIQQAALQGINTGHIVAFLNRMLDGAPIPSVIGRLLETWQGGATSEVTFERLLVLRTTAPETLDRIYNEPALRRYLGARLGPMACAIRPDQWEALRDALGEQGISVEVIG